MCLQSEQASSLSLSQKQMAAFSGHLGFGLALDQVSPAQPSQTVTTEDRQFQRVRVLVGSKNRLLCSAVYRRSPRRPEVPGGEEAAVLQPCLNHPGFLVHCYCVCVWSESNLVETILSLYPLRGSTRLAQHSLRQLSHLTGSREVSGSGVCSCGRIPSGDNL